MGPDPEQDFLESGGVGFAMLIAEAAGGSHAPIFDQVLEPNPEVGLAGTQEEKTLFYLDSQEKK